MNQTEDDRLIVALGQLAAPAPSDLLDRIAVRWAYVEGPLENIYVAFGPGGISNVVPASTVEGVDQFADAFRLHFGRPLLAADRPPDGVEEALRTGVGRGLRFDLGDRTPFEQEVLRATGDIPPGEVRPYSWIAQAIGRPGAVRAVGTALGHNPIPVLIPCHRVIRADGTVGQYGFGVAMKRRLLGGEGIDVDQVEATVRGGAAYLGDPADHVVCMPTCHRVRALPGDRRLAFRALGDATRLGYRPCPDCRPGGL
jgi:O-6-methylguanine DNA methyltransferase